MEQEFYGREMRRLPRVTITKTVRTKGDGKEYKGTLKDISASGAAVISDADLEKDLFVDLDIEDLGRFPGRVARTFEDGVGVVFDIGEEEEERLLAELEEIQNAIRTEDL